MKTLKTIGLLLLMATGVLAQPDPNNMFISGYVTDANGGAVANHEVCVYYNSGNPALPSDSACTSTNANGYYYLDILNGSLTGPNVTFTVSTYDPCAFLPLTQTVSNQQGSVDMATVDFSICANTGCNGLLPQISVSIDSTGLLCTFSASAIGGTPGYSYQWGGVVSNQFGNPVTYQASPGEIFDVCLTVADANGCTATTCDTVYAGNGNTGCSVEIQAVQSPNSPFVYTLTANAGGTPPFTYLWDNNQTGQTVTYAYNQQGIYGACVTVTDATGCTVTDCDTLVVDTNSTGNCSAGLYYWTSNPNNAVFAGDDIDFYFSGSFANTNYYFWSVQGMGMFFNSYDMNPVFNFPAAGTYEVCVEVYDSLINCSDTECLTIQVLSGNGNNCGGTISTSIDSSGQGLVYTFTANATGVAPFTYNWFDGSTAQIDVFVPGNINWDGIVCVEITDATGCIVTICDTVPVVNLGCQAYFTWHPDSLLGSPLPAVWFTDQSADASYWYWDFGDNTFSTDQNPLHTYSSTGTYVVCLTIVNADQSCTDTYCETVLVGNNNSGNCDASFSSSGPTPIGYTFSATVQDQNLYYGWSVDNQFVTGGAGDFTLSLSGLGNGVHTVCLMVIDSLNNCSDTDCLTFTVGSNNCYGYISGQVYAGGNNSPLDHGVVYLITYDPNTNLLTAVDSMVVDSGNYYFFGPLACGDYLVKAAAYANSQYYSNHIPTYYGNSPFWGFAQTVSLAQVNTQVSADIFLISANNPGGPGFIGGDVTQGANKTDQGDPLSGMQVMLFNMNGDAIAYAYTDENGEFGFNDLAYGTYQVYVEVLGVQTIPAIVTIGPNNPSFEDVHILATETVISTGIEDFDFEGAISEVYPNPVLDQASIQFDLPTAMKVNISILDLTGRAISSQQVAVSSGQTKVAVSAEGLTDGYYFLNIQDTDDNFSITRKFMRVD